jgi:hypothetical protein
MICNIQQISTEKNFTFEKKWNDWDNDRSAISESLLKRV